MNRIKWIVGKKENFEKLSTKDSSALYFLEDTGELFKGDKSFTEGVEVVESLPTVPAKGKIYVTSSGELKVWTGAEWKQINNVVASTLTDETASTTAVTGDAIKTYVANKLRNLASEGVEAKVKVSKEAGNMIVEKADGLYAKESNHIEGAVENDLISCDASGNVKDSGVKAGGATLSETPDVKTLATEIAVNAVKVSLETSMANAMQRDDIVQAISAEPSADKIVSEKCLANYISWEELK